MKKRFIVTALLVLSSSVLAGCAGESSSENGSSFASSSLETSSSESSSSQSSSIVKKNMLKEALKKDYSNMTASISLKTYNSFSDEDEEDSWSEFYYNDYTIVSYLVGEETNYSYYHEYNNESYLYFAQEKGNDNSKAGWLNKGWKDASLALGYTYFDFKDVLKNLDADDVAFINGNYYVNDKDVCTEMASNFLGTLNSYALDISYIQFTVDDSGYLSRITALEDANNEESNYLDISLFNFGNTTFSDELLPDAPTKDNVIEYWQYKGWSGPWVDKYVSSISIAIDGSVNSEEGVDAVLELDEVLTLKATLAPEDYNVSPTLEWHSTIPGIVEIEKATSGYGAKVTAYSGGEVEVYATYTPDNGGDVVTSNKIKIKVNGIPEQHKDDAIYDFDFASLSDDGEIIALNKVENTKPFDVTCTSPASGKVKINDGKNSDGAFEVGEKALILTDSGQSSTYSLDSYVQFNFGEQQVSSISLYYAMFFDDGMSALSWLSKCAIDISNDGVNWESISIKDEVNENISYKHKKLLEKSFAPSSYVRIATHSTMVGKGLAFAFNSVAFMANDDCNNYIEPSEKVNVESVVISSDASEAYVGKTIQFNGKVNPSNASKPALTWHSSNETVASIAQDGLLTGLIAGTTEVYAVADGVESNHVEVTIKDYPTVDKNLIGSFKGEYNYKEMLFTFVDNSLTVNYDEQTYSLTYTDYHNGALASDRYYVYTDDNGNEMDVRYSSDQLKVFGKLNNKTISLLEFSKYVPASKINLETDKTEFVYGVDKSFVVKANFTPNNASGYGVKELTWISSNTNVLEVNDSTNTSNTVTIKGAGTATIIASNEDGISGKISITVREKTLVNNLLLSPESGTIEVGETLQINASVNDDADVKDLTYKSNNTQIAKVSSTGLITGVKEGSTTITVKTTDGSNLEKTFTITVTASTAAIDTYFVGTWKYAYDDDGLYPLVVNADGTATMFGVNFNLVSSNSNTCEFISEDNKYTLTLSKGASYMDVKSNYDGEELYDIGIYDGMESGLNYEKI